MNTASKKIDNELGSIRDTVESIWVAIVLAFVLRAFMFEAFVIPTGSMAPRLYGEHFDITCQSCGYDYAHNMNVSGAMLRRYDRRTLAVPSDARCPNCLYKYTGREYINSGDRVLVLKYLYSFKEPQPWDVVVFKNPQTHRDNYIKRLIGLPGETIEIVHGDIFVKPGPDADWQVRRKPASVQKAMWQVVYENDFLPRAEWADQGKSPRWVQPKGQTHWSFDRAGGREFSFGGSDEPAKLEFKAPRESFLPYYGYNSARRPGYMNRNADVCSDLKLSCVFTPADDTAKVSLAMTSFEFEFKGELSADGTVEMLFRQTDSPDEQWVSWAKASIDPLETGEGIQFELVHADLEVQVWAAGKKVLASKGEQYPVDHQWLKERMSVTRRQPVPTPKVSLAASGGPSRLSHISIMRDDYYTSPPHLKELPNDATGDYVRKWLDHADQSPTRPAWGSTGWPIELTKNADNPQLDEFFMLGDNSPASHDGRTWSQAAPSLRLYDDQGRPQYKPGTVPRYDLIGRAFFVYWPSGYRPPGLAGLPIVPNAGRMRLVR